MGDACSCACASQPALRPLAKTANGPASGNESARHIVAKAKSILGPRLTASRAAMRLERPIARRRFGTVPDMFDEIGGMQDILPWIEHELDGGSRLMGFGHRVYRTRDPRADTLKDIVGNLYQSTDRMQFVEALEWAVLDALAAKYPNRRLDTNVEYYAALVLDGVGLPRELFTPAFAIGRVFGWCAHI